MAIANDETQLQEAGRSLSSSGLLCCVLVQRPRSVVSCYYQCCVCGYPPDAKDQDHLILSLLYPHWLCQQAFWRGPRSAAWSSPS